MLTLFLALGRRTLEMLGNAPESDPKKSPLKLFCKHINKLKMPLTPGNTQDAWFQHNLPAIIDIFLDLFDDDWQSFHSLLYILHKSGTPKHLKIANKYIKNAHSVSMGDSQKG